MRRVATNHDTKKQLSRFICPFLLDQIQTSLVNCLPVSFYPHNFAFSPCAVLQTGQHNAGVVDAVRFILFLSSIFSLLSLAISLFQVSKSLSRWKMHATACVNLVIRILAFERIRSRGFCFDPNSVLFL